MRCNLFHHQKCSQSFFIFFYIIFFPSIRTMVYTEGIIQLFCEIHSFFSICQVYFVYLLQMVKLRESSCAGKQMDISDNDSSKGYLTHFSFFFTSSPIHMHTARKTKVMNSNIVTVITTNRCETGLIMLIRKIAM